MANNGAGELAPLAGRRIWLSGAVPEGIEPLVVDRIAEFVRLFARRVFEQGGTVVHGSHPTFTPVLLKEAQSFREQRKRTAPLRLVVSEFFASAPDRFGVDVAAWDAICGESTIVTPAVREDASGEARARSRSLTLMRRELANQAHCIVSVGGNWWTNPSHPAGVPEEIELARDFNRPLFLLGGLGGATADYLKQHSEYLAICRNGLTDEDNLQLASTTDLDWIVTTVLKRVANPTSATVKEGPVNDDVVATECENVAALTSDRQAFTQAYGGNTKDDAHPPFYRILCLDGGGIRGAFSANALAAWETMTGEKIIDHFDLIVGTSTGGILAIGLGMGLSPANMVQFYRDEGPRIFP